MQLWQAALLGLVEGLTEFIPVSSTGHMIIVGHFLEVVGPKAATFEVFIQIGAILAVVWLYKPRFIALLRPRAEPGFSGPRGLLLLFLVTVPALVFGALAHGTIKERLFNPWSVAAGLAAGGLALVLVERVGPKPLKSGLDSVSARDAFLVGLFQCLALWPGMSRSACTILGGMLIGYERRTAVEFSFFAAVPVLFAAAAYDIYKNYLILEAADLATFALGLAAAFLSGWAAIRFLVKVVERHRLDVFGWYRLALAPLVFWLA